MSAARFGEPDSQSRFRWSSEPSRSVESEEAWVSREVDAMAAAWSRGHRLLASEIIERHPEIESEAAVRLIYEEVNLRRESGEEVRTTEIVGRYTRWKDELQLVLGCDRLLRPILGPAEMPDTGEYLGPFLLRSELGRGASGRTFLATEPTLADRPVVLKVISDDQDEHLSLARLQHTNIIPLFSEQSFPERRLRALCMPYLGGASLAHILSALAAIPPADRRGRDIVHALDRAQLPGPAPTTVDQPYRRYLQDHSYVHAICWIGTRLADALQEAHAHGLVHMDVKPSNVLIAADGAPMLLDFHLASRPLAAGESFPGRVGGTPGWMAPEQRAALDAVASGEPIPEAVDHRADIHALGALLREALGGDGTETSAPLRVRNPQVSVGLEDILIRCLAPRPADRYPSAASVRDDLRRHIENLPLRGVPNRSLRERWRKWRRSEPGALGAWAIALMVLCLTTGLLAAWDWDTHRGDEVQASIREARGLCDRGRYSDAEQRIRQALERAEVFPRHSGQVDELRGLLQIAQRGERADDIHRLAETCRFRFGVDPPTGPEADVLIRNVPTIWNDRHLLLARNSAPLSPKVEESIRADLLELVATWADVRIRLAQPSELATGRREVLEFLDEARNVCGRSFLLDRLWTSLARQAGRPIDPDETETPPRSAFDHYDLGRSYLRERRFDAAAEQFRQSLIDRPGDFWPNFYLGLSSYRLRRFDDAATAFTVCIAVDEPHRAQSYFNRALTNEALGRNEAAIKDYSRAIRWDSALASAWLNRGILHLKAERLDEATSDLGRAIQSAGDPRTRGRIYYNLSLAHLRRGDRETARAEADQAIALGDEEAWDLRDRLRSERSTPESPTPQ